MEWVCKYEFQQSTGESAFQYDVAFTSKTESYWQHINSRFVVQDEDILHRLSLRSLCTHTGRSYFMPGLCSWRTTRKSNKKFPLKTVYLDISRVWEMTLSYIAQWQPVSAKAASPLILMLWKIPLYEPAKPTCTHTKWFNIMITLWQIIVNRTSHGLTQKHAYRHQGVDSNPIPKYSTIFP